jgi:hypothetical protein
MNDYPHWMERELTESERIAAVRWALGLDDTDTSLDRTIRETLAAMTRRYPDVGEYEQRYRALDTIHHARYPR